MGTTVGATNARGPGTRIRGLAMSRGRVAQLAVDASVLSVAFLLAYHLRFDFSVPESQLDRARSQLPFIVASQLAVLFLLRVHTFMWRYVGMRELTVFVQAAILSAVPLLVGRLALPFGPWSIPLSVIFIDTILGFGGVLGARVVRRVVFERSERRSPRLPKSETSQRVLLIGAGQAGVLAAKELAGRQSGLNIRGFVDDDREKQGLVIHGIEVVGTTKDLPELVSRHHIDHVILAIARASRSQIRRIVEECERIPIRVRTIPGYYEILEGKVEVSRIRDVQIEDLLARDPVQLDTSSLRGLLEDRVVVVTGAGGSIGSELCRQIVHQMPSKLILVERAEPALFQIDRELRGFAPNLSLVPLVVDVGDVRRIEAVFATHRPSVVIHAAAHKHVPLMELNPVESIRNNVLATAALSDLAGRYQTDVFVQISTDKAVHPTSIMGASKRIAELVVQSQNTRHRTRFITVRFGNVLGSAGSVIPIFREQIRKGGPVTVTDPEMVRYFMTIPEASQLVLQAGAMGQGGEIFVLDMGEPVRIVDLARDMIRLSGFRPDEDIEVVFTGTRPGEKLFEELELEGESIQKTRHPKIFIGELAGIGAEAMEKVLERLHQLVEDADSDQLREYLAAITPGFEAVGAESRGSIEASLERCREAQSACAWNGRRSARPSVVSKNGQTVSRKLHRDLSLWALGPVLFLPPLLFGGVFAWSVVVIAALVAVFAGIVTWADRSPTGWCPQPALSWWLIGAAVWTGLQSLPLSCPLVETVAPLSVDLQRAVYRALDVERNYCSLSMDRAASTRQTLHWSAIAAVFAAAYALSMRGHARRVRQAVALSVLTTAAVTILHEVLGLAQVYGTYEPVYANPRFAGPLMNDNNFGGFLILGLFVLFGNASDAKEEAHRYLWGVAAVVVGATILLTLSRGAVAAAAMGAGVFVFSLVRRREGGGRARSVWIPLLGAAVAVGWGLFLGAGAIVRQFETEGFDKIELIARSLAMAADHPWVGVGRGAFSVAFSQHHGTHIRFEHAENFLAHWASEWGFLFTVGLLGALGQAVWKTRRTHRSASALGAATSLGTLAVHNLLDFNLELLGVAVPAVALLATIVAVPGNRRTAHSSKEPRPTTRLLRSPLPLAAAALAAALVTVGWQIPVQAAPRQRADLESALERGDYEGFHAHLRDAVSAHPAEPIFSVLAGTEAVQRGDPRAGRWLNHAMRLAPQWVAPHLLAAEWLHSLGRFRQASLELRTAALVDPARAAATLCRLFPDGSSSVVEAATPRVMRGERMLALAAECPHISDSMRRHLDAALVARNADVAGPWVRSAQEAKAEGNEAEATRLAHEARSRDSRDPRGHMTLAQLLRDQGRSREAISVLEAARRSVPNPRPVLQLEAELHADVGDNESMLEVLDALRALNAGDAHAIADVEMFRARLELRRQSLPSAIRAYENAYRLSPRPEFLIQVARLAERMGDTRHALSAYRRLQELTPNDPEYRTAILRLTTSTRQ